MDHRRIRPAPLSIKQAAHQLRVSDKTLRRWINRGQIDAHRMRDGAKCRWYIEQAEVWRINFERIQPKLQNTYDRVAEQLDEWYRAFGTDPMVVLRQVAYGKVMCTQNTTTPEPDVSPARASAGG